MDKIEQLINAYVNHYELLGKESRKRVLNRVLEEIDRICIEEEWAWLYFDGNSNSSIGIVGILKYDLEGRYSENREQCQIKCFEEIAQKIKKRYKVNYEELLELFESSMNINKDNYKDRFGNYAKKFSDSVILVSEVGVLMKLFCIKEFETSIQKSSNPYWEVLFERLMSLKNTKITNLGMSDEFKEKYLPDYYKKVNNMSFLGGEEDGDLLLKYIDNPTIKSYLYSIKEQLSEEQFGCLLEKTKLSEIHMVFNGKRRKEEFYHEILQGKINELYADDNASEIMNLLIKLPMKFRERLSAIIEDKDFTIEMLKHINILSAIFGDNVEYPFKIVTYYPELTKSIDSVEKLTEETSELLNKLARMPQISQKPKSFDELKEIFSNPIISTVERKDDRFQPDSSDLGGSIGGYRTIIVIDKNGEISKRSNNTHYKLVALVYGLPDTKKDYFYDLIEKSNEGNITIITEGSSAFVYFPKNITNTKLKIFEEIMDENNVNDSNFDFYMIQSLGAKEEDEEKFRAYEGNDKNLTRADAIKVLQNSIEKDEIETGNREGKIEAELDR